VQAPFGYVVTWKPPFIGQLLFGRRRDVSVDGTVGGVVIRGVQTSPAPVASVVPVNKTVQVLSVYLPAV